VADLSQVLKCKLTFEMELFDVQFLTWRICTSPLKHKLQPPPFRQFYSSAFKDSHEKGLTLLSTGSGVADLSQVPAIKAQLLGFLLYGTSHSIQRILDTFGSGEEGSSIADLDALLPGPHPVLRCLISVSSGDFLHPEFLKAPKAEIAFTLA